MVFEKDELKKLIKEKKLKTLDDFNDFMRQISKEVLEGLLDGEMTDLLGYKKHDQEAKKTDNARNGFSSKGVNSKFGKIDLEVPRDRQADFDPIVVKKRQKDISGLEEKIISMYAKGMTTRDIQAHIQDIYGYELSPETISSLTDRIMDKAREWQNRPLQPIYAVVFMDALFLKMRCEGQVRNVAIYSILGIDLEGQKECLGLWICETESAKYWISVLNELKNRGIEDVLIFSVDGLSGLSDALQAAFPQADVQRCIVHQIRNSLRYVSWKERKAMARDLKGIYKAASEKEALAALDDFEKAWNKKYPHVAASWRRNWAELATYFKYPQPVRTLIYTTNPIESMNRGLKKVTKNRAIFPNEDALFKLLYLAIGDISKKWTARVRDWAAIYPQLLIFFDQRLHKYINK